MFHVVVGKVAQESNLMQDCHQVLHFCSCIVMFFLSCDNGLLFCLLLGLGMTKLRADYIRVKLGAIWSRICLPISYLKM